MATTECHVALGQYFQAVLVQSGEILIPVVGCYFVLSVLGQVAFLELIVPSLLALFSAGFLFIVVAHHKRKKHIMLGALLVFSAPIFSLLLANESAWICCIAFSILMLCLSLSMTIAYFFCTSPGGYLSQKSNEYHWFSKKSHGQVSKA
jgi:hypothetical protein